MRVDFRFRPEPIELRLSDMILINAVGRGSMLRAIALLSLSLLSLPVFAADFTIGYLELARDARYGKKRLYARYLMQPLGRPFAGATIALGEVKFHGAALGITFRLEKRRAATAAGLLLELESLKTQGVEHILLDAPAEVVAELGRATRDNKLLLYNISAREDRLRQSDCQPHLLHMMPSHAMLMDALSQYLVSRKWNRILLLRGPLDADALLAQAFERAAKRYGAKIVETREFVLSNDPRQRDQGNIALLTADIDYDVLLVVDSDGEFARKVPYHSIRPQLVAGSEGLAPAAWHWSWDRHGAPQLENRFERHASRPMADGDWAAWMGVKSIAEAVQRTSSIAFDPLREYLLSPEAVLDGFKGNRLNFRPWNNQLRQPILLATHNWVVDRAPIKGFLHQTNNLDTLGFDQRESECTF